MSHHSVQSAYQSINFRAPVTARTDSVSQALKLICLPGDPLFSLQFNGAPVSAPNLTLSTVAEAGEVSTVVMFDLY